MKKRIVASLLLASMVLSVPGGGKAANENYINENNIKSDLLVIVAEEEDDLIGYSLTSGDNWYIDKEYNLGDIIAVSINDCGTDNKNDDIMISNTKAGSVKCELSKNKKEVEWFSFNSTMYSQEDFN